MMKNKYRKEIYEPQRQIKRGLGGFFLTRAIETDSPPSAWARSLATGLLPGRQGRPDNLAGTACAANVRDATLRRRSLSFAVRWAGSDAVSRLYAVREAVEDFPGAGPVYVRRATRFRRKAATAKSSCGRAAGRQRGRIHGSGCKTEWVKHIRKCRHSRHEALRACARNQDWNSKTDGHHSRYRFVQAARAAPGKGAPARPGGAQEA